MAQSLYKTLFGDGFDRLPPTVREMHSGVIRAAGRADVEYGNSPLARTICRLAKFPAAGTDVPAEVQFDVLSKGERWTRNFGGQSFQTEMLFERGAPAPSLIEKFGPLRFRLRVVAHGDGVDLTPEGARLFGLPLPRFLCPEAVGMERERDGRYWFDVSVRFPLVGDVVHYRGWLEPVEKRRA